MNEQREAERDCIRLDEVTNADARSFLRIKSGERLGCLIRKSPVMVEGTLCGYFLIIKNMMKLDKIAQDYLESELNYRTIAENMQDVLILMDKNKEYLYVSASSKAVFGFDHTQINNRTAFFNIHHDYIEVMEANFERVFQQGIPFEMMLKAWHEEREWIWTEIKGKAVYSANGQFKHILLVARDISKEREQEEALRHIAYHDMMTGLPNRRMLTEQLDLALEQLTLQNQLFAVMILDIDNFKMINDSYGHEIGDEVIITFGNRIQQLIVDCGIVVRYGGDEFVVLIKDFKHQQQLEQLARKINEAVREPITIQQTVVEITSSIGISICRQIGCSANQILKQADDALYKVKKLGKDQFSIYPAQ